MFVVFDCADVSDFYAAVAVHFKTELAGTIAEGKVLAHLGERVEGRSEFFPDGFKEAGGGKHGAEAGACYLEEGIVWVVVVRESVCPDCAVLVLLVGDVVVDDGGDGVFALEIDTCYVVKAGVHVCGKGFQQIGRERHVRIQPEHAVVVFHERVSGELVAAVIDEGVCVDRVGCVGRFAQVQQGRHEVHGHHIEARDRDKRSGGNKNHILSVRVCTFCVRCFWPERTHKNRCIIRV